jgi:hypothetical protein
MLIVGAGGAEPAFGNAMIDISADIRAINGYPDIGV